MSRRERRWVLVAGLLSVLVHAAVAWPVWNMALGAGRGRSLFAVRDGAEDQPMRVERARMDEIVGGEADAMAAPGGWEKERMGKVDVKRMVRPAPGRMGEGEMVSSGEVGIAKPRAAAAAGSEGALTGTGRVDWVAEDLGRMDMGVRLPGYVGARDGAKVAGPSDEPIGVAQHVRVGKVKASGSGTGVMGGDATDLIAGSGSGGGGGNVLGGGGGVASVPIPLPEARLPAEERMPVRKVDEHLDDDFEYVLRRYASEKNFRGRGRDFRGFEVEIRPRASLKRLKALGKDVVYVVDTSGSIGAQWLHSAKIGVGAAMDALNAGDRFNVVLFAEKVRVLDAGGLVDATAENVEKARRFIVEGTSAGYTDVNQALAKLVRRGVGEDRVYQVIFVSDGQPTAGSVNPREIIDAFTRENNLTAAIYAVAVGEDVNRELLGALAYRNKGYVVSGVNAIRCGDVVRDLASRLRYPILKDATFSAAGVDASEIYPRQPRDVYQNDPVVLYGRYERLDQKLSMRTTGTSGAKHMDFSFTKSISEAKAGDAGIMKNWAERKMHHLTAAMLREGGGDGGAIRKEIEGLKKEYGLE
ncbi:MAG: VWA domain-containing protein [Phycisphaerales bacterium]